MNAGPSPVTYSLLPNVSMTSRPVSIRVDMRPNSTWSRVAIAQEGGGEAGLYTSFYVILLQKGSL
jgi:hypothetical protein